MPNPTPVIDMSYAGLVTRAKQYLADLILNHEKVPARASYNKLIGGWTTSKSDVVKTCKANLMNLNTVSMTLYGKEVVTFKTEEETLPKITINEGEG